MIDNHFCWGGLVRGKSITKGAASVLLNLGVNPASKFGHLGVDSVHPILKPYFHAFLMMILMLAKVILIINMIVFSQQHSRLPS